MAQAAVAAEMESRICPTCKERTLCPPQVCKGEFTAENVGRWFQKVCLYTAESSPGHSDLLILVLFQYIQKGHYLQWLPMV